MLHYGQWKTHPCQYNPWCTDIGQLTVLDCQQDKIAFDKEFSIFPAFMMFHWGCKFQQNGISIVGMLVMMIPNKMVTTVYLNLNWKTIDYSPSHSACNAKQFRHAHKALYVFH
jgi:hypothetical protein